MNHVYLTALLGNIATFSVGTTLTWSSPELSKLNSTHSPFGSEITRLEASWISTFLAVGCIFGPFFFGWLPDCIGRKYTLLATGFPLLISYLLLAYGKSVLVFYIGRFISGLSSGAIFVLLPNYIAEIADASNRGVLGSIMGVFLCAGILYSSSVGPYCSIKIFNLTLATAPLLFIFLFFLFGTESPQYYINREQPVKARNLLQRLRGRGTNIEEELRMLEKKRSENSNGSLLDIFRSKGLTKAFIMVVGLIIFQQLSGINAILFFSKSIFEKAGSPLSSTICSILTGCVQVCASVLTPFVIERIGRRILLMFSSICMLLAELFLGVYIFLYDHDYNVSSLSFISIPCLMAYFIAFSVGFGSVPWIMMGEVLPANVKYIVSMVTTTICWVIGFLVAHYFRSISHSIGTGECFMTFAGFCAISTIFVYTFVIETKGKSIHEIHEKLMC